MAIGLRDIKNLEELTELNDESRIIIIDNGVAKTISKANAKFGGGGGTTIFGCEEQEEEPE